MSKTTDQRNNEPSTKAIDQALKDFEAGAELGSNSDSEVNDLYKRFAQDSLDLAAHAKWCSGRAQDEGVSDSIQDNANQFLRQHNYWANKTQEDEHTKTEPKQDNADFVANCQNMSGVSTGHTSPLPIHTKLPWRETEKRIISNEQEPDLDARNRARETYARSPELRNQYA